MSFTVTHALLGGLTLCFRTGSQSFSLYKAAHSEKSFPYINCIVFYADFFGAELIGRR